VIPTLRRGGAENQLSYLAPALVALGVDLHVATFEAGPNADVLRQAGVSLHVVPQRVSHDPRAVWALVRLVREIRPAIVQTWLTKAGVLGGLAAIATATPWIHSERRQPEGFALDWKAGLEAFLAARFARMIVSNSRSADRMWSQRVPDRARRRVVANSLPAERLRAAPPGDVGALGLPASLPLVLYVGRLLPEKGIATLLEALRQVRAEREICAAILGAGSLEATVRTWIASHAAAPWLAAPGFRSDVASWLRRAQVFVSLSEVEGMPNAVMEAMALGAPIVASDIAAHREILSAATALLVPLGDAAAAASGILACLSDPRPAEERARRAQEHARAWTPEVAAAAYREAYEAVLRR
jgi:glycosyltransferase involved in cell wall biosynthesis